jgi:hypothetical protein
MDLVREIAKIAKENPEFRADLVPLLEKFAFYAQSIRDTSEGKEILTTILRKLIVDDYAPAIANAVGSTFHTYEPTGKENAANFQAFLKSRGNMVVKVQAVSNEGFPLFPRWLNRALLNMGDWGLQYVVKPLARPQHIFQALRGYKDQKRDSVNKPIKTWAAALERVRREGKDAWSWFTFDPKDVAEKIDIEFKKFMQEERAAQMFRDQAQAILSQDKNLKAILNAILKVFIKAVKDSESTIVANFEARTKKAFLGQILQVVLRGKPTDLTQETLIPAVVSGISDTESQIKKQVGEAISAPDIKLVLDSLKGINIGVLLKDLKHHLIPSVRARLKPKYYGAKKASLRRSVIRLAHDRPELRKDLLPLVR